MQNDIKTSHVSARVARSADGLRLDIASLSTDLKLSSVGPLVSIHGHCGSLPYVVSSIDAKRIEVLACSRTCLFSHSLTKLLFTDS